jgi:hypothetical protein
MGLVSDPNDRKDTRMRKTLLATVAAAALAVPLFGAVAAPANAAAGDEIIVNGDFSNYDPATGANLDGVTTTDFKLTTSLHQANSPDTGDMYDPGRYAISPNPGSLHNQWVQYAGDNPKMVLNGFTEGVQTVWQQSAQGTVCTTPGSTLAYAFQADVANVLPLDQYSDGGANIEVIINGVSLGAVDLTSNNGTPVTIAGGSIPAVNPMVIKIVNHATQYIGNDFSLDNLSLKQVGGCTVPTTATFNFSPTAPTCIAAGSFNTGQFPVDREGYTLTVDHLFNGPGDYVITALAKSGFFIDGPSTATIHVLPQLTGAACAPPSIGGRTIGFWTNKNGTIAEGGKLWPSVASTYPKVVQGLTFAQAQVYIKGANSSGDGVSMMRAQFFATALNVNYISGYGAQHVSVPANVATLLNIGQCSTVTDLLTAVNSKYATIITSKASVTSVTAVLDRINQDIPLAPQQCV